MSGSTEFIQSALTLELQELYTNLKVDIENRLEDFSKIPQNQYFYELCFCICTPQSKAEHALIVQNKLMDSDFLSQPEINPLPILNNPSHYIRFHNQKSKRLLTLKENWDIILEMLVSEKSSIEKRDWLAANINGIGMKEASHYLRNIGHRGLAILDRHILKNLVLCGVFPEVPNISTYKRYRDAEDKFLEFSSHVGIEIDHLDLLFWAKQAGTIIK